MKFVVAIVLVSFALLVADQAQAGSLPRYYPTHGQKTFVFSPKDREWAAYDAEGYRVSEGIANGGKPGHQTPAGTYTVYDRQGSDYKSSRYPTAAENGNGVAGGAPMPYAMHFTKAGHAIHGSAYISNVNGSHGCIRVKTSAAYWLNKNFITPGTKVVVQSY